MTNQTFEANWQKTQNGPWKSKDFDTQEEAKKFAEWWGQFCWNCNWQATRPGQDNRPAWTARNGQTK